MKSIAPGVFFKSQPSGRGKDIPSEWIRGAVVTAGCSAWIESMKDHCGVSVMILSPRFRQ